MKIIFKYVGLVWAIAFLSFFALLLYSGTGTEIPPIAKQYVSNFHNFLESFLTSQWFFIIFAVGWLGVSYTLGKESGWQNLAKKYSDMSQGRTTVEFYRGNGYLGKIRHNGILRVAADNQGIYLRVLFPFKFGHKNLFIPWSDISTITSEKGLFSKKTPEFLKNISKSLSKTNYLNIKLHQFPEQRLTVQCFDDILSSVPQNLMT